MQTRRSAHGLWAVAAAFVVALSACGSDEDGDGGNGGATGGTGGTSTGGTGGTSTGGTGGTSTGGTGGTSTGGVAGSAGSGGVAGSAGSGGSAGSAASGGVAGSAGSGGSAGTAGSGGVAGSAGTAGSGGSAGTAGSGGGAGAAGFGGLEPMVYGIDDQSCDQLGLCNDDGTDVSCCSTGTVQGASFPMGRSDSGTDAYSFGQDDELPEHDATVDSFELDVFEVTVGRFRKFVEAYDGTLPSDGDGAHPLIAGTGWDTAWNTIMPSTKADLIDAIKCDATLQTWTDTPGANENQPINCINWYEAFAFCIWDGSRLPTEAEWEFAAAGGSENRLFPWGATFPDATYANYSAGANDSHIDVGSTPLGKGRYGQHDLSGSVWEWVTDTYSSLWYGGGGSTCDNCANLTGAYRVNRGGGYTSNVPALRPATRSYDDPADNIRRHGIRCAR